MSWLSKLFGKKPQRYDNVTITNVVTGSKITGHAAVAAHLEEEEELLDTHGSTITFQLYAIDPAAQTRAEMQGPRLAELSIPGSQVSGTDTVAAVKQRVLTQLFGDHKPAAHVTFVISGREMTDDALFYAAHFILLPCWIQVVSSDVPFTDVLATMKTLHG